MLTLYYSPGACSLAAHIALLENKLQFNLIKVNLGTHQTESGVDLATVNPKNYVPVLELENGETITENIAILYYVTEHGPQANMFAPSNSLHGYRLLENLAFVSTEFHKAFGAFFDKRTPEEYKVLARERLAKRCDYVDQSLATQQFLQDDQFSAADAYFFTILRWLKKVDTGLSMSTWTNICAYYDRVAQRPAVQAALTEEKLQY